MTQQNNSFLDDCAAYGVEIPKEGTMVNKGNSFNYEHPEGQYKVLIAGLEVKYKNANGDKCEKDAPGAKLSAMGLRMIIIASTKQNNLIQDGSSVRLNEVVPYKEISYYHSLSLDERYTFSHVNLFQEFYLEGVKDEARIISGERYKEKIELGLLTYYIGATCVMTIGKLGKSERIGLQKLELTDHKLTPDLYKKRKAAVDMILGLLAQKLEEEKEARKNTTASHEEEGEVADPNNMNFGFQTGW